MVVKRKFASVVVLALGAAGAQAHLHTFWSAALGLEGAVLKPKMSVSTLSHVYVAGTRSAGPADDSTSDWYVSQYAVEGGELKWTRTFAGSAEGKDVLNRIAVASDGGIIAVGMETTSADGNQRAYLRKYNTNGSVAFNRTFVGNVPKDTMFSDVTVGADGSIYATGQATYASRGQDMVIVKWNSAGVQQYYRVWAGLFGSNETGGLIRLAANGNLGYVAGARNGQKIGLFRFETATGRILSANTYPTSSKDILTGFEVKPNGDLAVVGTLAYKTKDSCGVLATFDTNCRLKTARRFGSLTDGLMTEAVGVVVDEMSNSYVGYHTYKQDNTSSLAFMGRVSPLNVLNWTKRHQSADLQKLASIAMDHHGNLIAAVNKPTSGFAWMLGRDGLDEDENPSPGILTHISARRAFATEVGPSAETPGEMSTRVLFRQARIDGPRQFSAGTHTLWAGLPEKVGTPRVINLTYPEGVTGPATVTVAANQYWKEFQIEVSAVATPRMDILRVTNGAESSPFWITLQP